MVASIALCFIPLIAVYLCFAILVKDFNKWSGLLACLLGLLAFVPIMAIDFVKDPYLGGSQISQLMKFFLLALVEEGIKMALMFFLPSKKSSQLTFVSYAILLGMTLGCFETLLYLIVIVSRTGFRWWAIIIHLVCSGLSGIFVYSIKKKNLLITPFVFAVLFHGVYNYFADFVDFRKYFSLAVMLIALVELKLRYEVLKSDLIENNKNKLSNNLEKDKSKGEPKNMGFKDFVKSLFGKKEEKNDVPEQSVFNTTQVNASEFNSEKTEEAPALANQKEETVVSTVVSTAEKIVSTTSSLLNSSNEKKEEKKDEKSWGSLLTKEPAKFVDDPVVVEEPIEEVPVPAPLVAEPVAEEKPAAEKKTTRTRTSSAKTTEKDSEKKSTTKKTSEKSDAAKTTKSTTTKKTAAKKTSAAKTTDAETPKTPAKRGRKPAAEKTESTVAATPAKRGRKPAAAKTVAEEKKSEETKSTTKKASTSKASSTKTVAEEKKTTTAKKTAAKKTDATKTTDAEAPKTPAKRGRKPAAAKVAASETVEQVKTEVKAAAKKATTTAKKVADVAEKAGAEVKAAAKKTTTKKAADGEKTTAKKPAAKKSTTKKADDKKTETK